MRSRAHTSVVFRCGSGRRSGPPSSGSDWMTWRQRETGNGATGVFSILTCRKLGIHIFNPFLDVFVVYLCIVKRSCFWEYLQEQRIVSVLRNGCRSSPHWPPNIFSFLQSSNIYSILYQFMWLNSSHHHDRKALLWTAGIGRRVSRITGQIMRIVGRFRAPVKANGTMKLAPPDGSISVNDQTVRVMYLPAP